MSDFLFSRCYFTWLIDIFDGFKAVPFSFRNTGQSVCVRPWSGCWLCNSGCLLLYAQRMHWGEILNRYWYGHLVQNKFTSVNSSLVENVIKNRMLPAICISHNSYVSQRSWVPSIKGWKIMFLNIKLWRLWVSHPLRCIISSTNWESLEKSLCARYRAANQ